MISFLLWFLFEFLIFLGGGGLGNRTNRVNLLSSGHLLPVYFWSTSSWRNSKLATHFLWMKLYFSQFLPIPLSISTSINPFPPSLFLLYKISPRVLDSLLPSQLRQNTCKFTRSMTPRIFVGLPTRLTILQVQEFVKLIQRKWRRSWMSSAWLSVRL